MGSSIDNYHRQLKMLIKNITSFETKILIENWQGKNVLVFVRQGLLNSNGIYWRVKYKCVIFLCFYISIENESLETIS